MPRSLSFFLGSRSLVSDMATRENCAMPNPCSPDTERSSLLGRGYPAQDEENRLDRDRDPSPASTAVSDYGSGLRQWTTMLVLLVGVLVVNSDSAILMTLFRHVASEFSRLNSSSWILSSYIIGIISTQPLVRSRPSHRGFRHG